MDSKKTSTGKFGMRRTAMALAVASAFGLGANVAFAVAPVINFYTPTDNATGAGITADLQVSFDQNVTAVAGKNVVIKKAADDSIVETIAADNTSRVTVSNSKVTINPTADLALSTGYYVQIDAGAFQNAGAEGYVGITDATTWNFSTAAAATVTSYSPANGAIDFVETANLSLTFVENVTAISGKNIKIYKADGTLVESIAANDTAKVTVSGGSVTINPAAILPVGSYYVQIDAGAFTGNTSSASYAGIADTTTWAFTSVADTTAPTTMFNPADNATGTTPSGNLVLYFDETVTAVTGKNIKIYKSDGTLVETLAANDTGKVVLSSSKGSTSVTINPVADLSFNTGYYVQIDTGAFQDAATTPNVYAGIADATTWNFTTAAGAVVTSNYPINGATDFPETANLTLYFSENVTAVTGKNIKIYNSANTLIETIAANDTAKVTVFPQFGQVNINPAANLPVGSYYVQIDAGAFTGNTSSASYAGIADTTTWAFATVADTAAPTAISVQPLDNSAGAHPSGGLYLYFGENVTAVSGKNIKIYKADNTLVETIVANDTTKVTVSSGVVTINPAAALALNTGYYVQIDAGAFQDTATTPNAYAGIADATTWNFTTAAGATVTSYNPANGATTFAETGDLLLDFSELVTAVSGKNIRIYKSDGTLVETLAANDTTRVTINNVYYSSSPNYMFSYVRINPAANLTAGSYYVQIDAGAFTGNTSGASYAGIADTTTWAFTTVADTAAPTVSTYSPADNATAASPGTNFMLYFNESVTAVTGKNLKVYKSDNTLVETIAANDTGKVTVSGSKVTVNPAADLALNTGYYVQIDAGAFQDTATTPNAYAGISDATTWNFTTAGGATVTSYYPANGATNYSETGTLQLDISENVTPVAGKNIKIYKSDNTLVETIAADDLMTAANPSGKVNIFNISGAYYLTITPATTLAAGSYYVNIDAGAAVGNVSGASYAGIADSTTWAFTTVADTTAPAVYGLVPSNNATAVSLNAYYLHLGFFERVTAVAGKSIVIKKSSDNSVVETIAADDTSKVTVTGNGVVINPVTDLAYSTDYYVNVDAGAFQDKATTPNAYAGISDATTWKFTTAAAPAPTPTPTPTPSSSGSSSTSTTTAAPGGSTTTVGNTTTPVDASAGSTLNVTSGTSGATINLPTPPTTGATATDAVNVKIGDSNLSVKPTESGSVVKTATVSIDGKDTTVLNVTAGTAQVTASVANQPLVSVGSGANAVVISSGSAGATVITSVDKTTGVTSLTLPKSTTGHDADASVKMTIGGQDVNVKPSGGLDVVVTLKTVSVGGKDVQVVSVTGGSATVTSSQPGQPLLAIGSGSSAVVVTGGSVGSEATSRVDSATGNTTLSITSGTITLPSNAFAEVGNGFAAIKDGKLYAGEVAVFNSAGKISSVRLGSQSGVAANVGDPIKATSTAGLTTNVAVPNLKGKVARVSDTQDFGDVMVASLGAGFTSKGQNSSGVLSLIFPDGGSANALPLGEITVDTSRADGISIIGNGKVEVVKSGVIARFAPAVADPVQFAVQVVALDKKAGVTVNDYGVLQASVNGITYALQPAWMVSKADGGAAGFTTDADGRVVYQDGAGNVQTLYPAFIDFAQLVTAFKSLDANTGATGHDDGTVTAKLLGVTYTLTPDYAVIPVQAEHAKDAWWVDGGKVYVKTGDGKSAQGFNVK